MNYLELVQALARLFRSTKDDIFNLIRTAPYQYKHYQIPKRSGGMRDIHHPTPNLKAAQRWMTGELISKLRVHNAVYSYRAGLSIRDHAKVHLHSNYLMRIDFSNFFPSIDANWLSEFLCEESSSGRLPIESDAIPSLVRLACRFNKADKSFALSIGAPSSPAISNAILYSLDERISLECNALDCLYTRYADDLYISSREPNALQAAELALRAAVTESAPKLQINENKSTNVSKKTRRIVTGLTLTPDRNLSVGRDLKRSIRTEVYLALTDRLDIERRSRLCGLLTFIRHVEPAFIKGLELKFGAAQIEKLLTHRSQSPKRS